VRTSAGIAIMQTAEAYAQRRLSSDWVASVLSSRLRRSGSGDVASPPGASTPPPATPPRLPVGSDGEFRAALRDGVLLCRLVNALSPGAVPKARGARERAPIHARTIPRRGPRLEPPPSARARAAAAAAAARCLTPP
jgi:hypothetical protein